MAVRITGRVTTTGLVRIVAFSGWQAQILNWNEIPFNWNIWQ